MKEITSSDHTHVQATDEPGGFGSSRHTSLKLKRNRCASQESGSIKLREGLHPGQLRQVQHRNQLSPEAFQAFLLFL